MKKYVYEFNTIDEFLKLAYLAVKMEKRINEGNILFFKKKDVRVFMVGAEIDLTRYDEETVKAFEGKKKEDTMKIESLLFKYGAKINRLKRL